jgi:uridylate kinase
MRQIAEPYIRNRAVRHFEKGRVVIFGCGTGNPIYNRHCRGTQSGGINADILFKATNVDGVYDKDPNKFADAKKYDYLSFKDVSYKRLKGHGWHCRHLCRDNNIRILVFNLENPPIL